MSIVELVLAILKFRRWLPAVMAMGGVLAGIAFATYVPQALVAGQTHIGLPSPTTYAATLVWPAIGAFVVFLVHRCLPSRLERSGQYLAVGRRPGALCAASLCLVGGSTLLGWIRHEAWMRALPYLFLAPSLILIGAVISFQTRELPVPSPPGQAKPSEGAPKSVATWARSLSNSIVAGFAIAMALVVWTAMLWLPAGVGGLREKCVQLEISTAGMPLTARRALVGTAAAKHKPHGREMTLPARILRKDDRDAFLWMSTGRGVTVPLERIGIIMDFDEGTTGCVADGS